MKKQKIISIVVLLILVIWIKSNDDNSEESTNQEDYLVENIDYKVIRIVDGDTYILKGKKGKKFRVRVIGIDTPETKHPWKEVDAVGLLASEYCEKNYLGKTVNLMYEKDSLDQFDRVLAHVLIDGERSVAEELLKLGYAKAVCFKPNCKFYEKFKKLENFQ